jgi:hypothetical protein
MMKPIRSWVEGSADRSDGKIGAIASKSEAPGRRVRRQHASATCFGSILSGVIPRSARSRRSTSGVAGSVSMSS